jgi:tetratricopeptide (TPR) repeat protein
MQSHLTQATLLRGVLAGAAVLVCGSLTAMGADVLRTIDGDRLTVTVTGSSRDGLTIEEREGGERLVSTAEIVDVQFEGEPQELRTARNLLARGRAADALTELEAIDTDSANNLTDLMKAEQAYIKAAANAEAALLDPGNTDRLREAGREVLAFATAFPQSFRYFRTRELVGDLLAASGDTAKASEFYEQLAAGPPAMKIRAATARGRMLLGAGDHAGAVAAFEQAEATEATDAASLEQKRLASLGKARGLGLQGKGAEAIDVVNKLLNGANPEDAELLGPAYLALGDAHQAAGRLQDAAISYLTVDLVYNTNPAAHAEALAKLADVWEAMGQPERSREARGTLKATYPDTSWARSGS